MANSFDQLFKFFIEHDNGAVRKAKQQEQLCFNRAKSHGERDVLNFLAKDLIENRLIVSIQIYLPGN